MNLCGATWGIGNWTCRLNADHDGSHSIDPADNVRRNFPPRPVDRGGVWLARIVDRSSEKVVLAKAYYDYNLATGWLSSADPNGLPELFVAEVRFFYCSPEVARYLA